MHSHQTLSAIVDGRILKRLGDRLATGGRLLTYSRSAAVRASLKLRV